MITTWGREGILVGGTSPSEGCADSVREHRTTPFAPSGNCAGVSRGKKSARGLGNRGRARSTRLQFVSCLTSIPDAPSVRGPRRTPLDPLARQLRSPHRRSPDRVPASGKSPLCCRQSSRHNMQISKSSGLKLLPPVPKKAALRFDTSAASWKDHLEESSQDELSRELLAPAYWALWLMEAAQEEGLEQQIPGCRYLAFGFLDPETEQDAFGIAAIVNPGVRSERSRGVRPFVDSLAEFPVFLRPVVEQLHRSPTVMPISGSAGCWGKSRRKRNRPIGPGILTAKHVLPQGVLGAPVPLSNSTFGTVLDLGPDGVDAALVETQEARGTTRLQAPSFIAPWTDVEFFGASSGHHVTKITTVTDTRGVLSSSLAPARIMLADFGRAGDSGALVMVSKRRAAAGIYLGVLTDPAGRSEGIAQHAGQVTKCMDMELST